MSKKKELLERGVEALEKTVSEVLKDEDLSVKSKMKFAKKIDNGLRTVKEALEHLEG